MDNPGYFRQAVGDLVVTALYDGTVDVPLDALHGISPADAAALQARDFRTASPAKPMAIFAVTVGDRTILIDAGGSAAIDPDLGRARTSMAAAGLDPTAISAVLLTHLHTDHFGGLLLDDGTAAFPKADLIIPAGDRPFRLDPPDLAALSHGARWSTGLARAAVAPYQDRTRFVTDREVLPGLSILPLPGHTPGHSGYLLTSRGESLLIWGDVIHFPSVQFARPEASLVYDVDPEQARSSRRSILHQAADQRWLVAGMHHDFPGFGHVATDGAAFRYVLARQWS